MDVVLTGAAGSCRCKLRLRDGITPGVLLCPVGMGWPEPPEALLGGAPWAPVSFESA